MMPPGTYDQASGGPLPAANHAREGQPQAATSHAAVALARLLASLDGWRAARRKTRALRALALATRLSPRTVIEVALAGAAAAGFQLMKDGREYAVLLDGERVRPPPETPAHTAGGKAVDLAAGSGPQAEDDGPGRNP